MTVNIKLTAEAARAAAAAYGAVFGGGGAVSDWFRAEADRLEDAAKTAGQVLCDAYGESWYDSNSDDRRRFEAQAAAVIAHYVRSEVVAEERNR